MLCSQRKELDPVTTVRLTKWDRYQERDLGGRARLLKTSKLMFLGLKSEKAKVFYFPRLS